MATVRLSKTGNLYQLAVNGWNKSTDAINLVVIATDEPTEVAAEAFKDNDIVVMHDAAIHITAEGYTHCRSIDRINNYPVGGMDAHGDDILADVWKISLSDTEQTEEELPFTDEPYAEEVKQTEEIPAEG